jgi:hypothetical protein
MKKPSSLAQQIQNAQQIVESWSAWHKSTLQLEGSDIFLTRQSSEKSNPQQAEENIPKEKLHA